MRKLMFSLMFLFFCILLATCSLADYKNPPPPTPTPTLVRTPIQPQVKPRPSATGIAAETIPLTSGTAEHTENKLNLCASCLHIGTGVDSAVIRGEPPFWGSLITP